eukprot:Opistho-2@12865
MTSLEEYFRSTFEKKLLTKMPEREEDHLTAATRLLEKRREMAEVQQALAGQKDEFHNKMESIQQRREELERKEYQLKESLFKFDKFLKENDSKRARADKKAHDERIQRDTKVKEITTLKDELSQLSRARDKQNALVRKLLHYQHYLERVLETSEEFSEVREIIARYDTLVATNEDLLARQRRNQDENERKRAELNKFTEEKNNEILNYNNRLANLQKTFEETQMRALKWEAEWNHILNTAAKKTLLLGQIKMATHNLFSLVNRHLKMRLGACKTIEQLERIQEFVEDLSQITESASLE